MIARAHQVFLALATLVSLAGGAARARVRSPPREPVERRVVLARGATRMLPGERWVLDDGAATVDLGTGGGGGTSLRAVRPGFATMHREGERLRVVVVDGAFVRGEPGNVVFAASFSGRDRSGAFVDEALAAELRVPREFADGLALRIVTFDSNGAFVGEAAFPAGSTPCPDDSSLRCFSSGPVRVVTDAIEIDDAQLGERAIAARFGGRVAVLAGSEELIAAPVCLAGDGPCGFEVVLRPVLVRAYVGGPTVFRGEGAREGEVLRERIEYVMKPWEACGIRARTLPVAVVDPPREVLLSFGLPFGLPSDGTEVVEVRAGTRSETVTVPPMLAPREAARYVEERLRRRGFDVVFVERPWLVHEERPVGELRLRAPRGDVRVRVARAGRLALEATLVELRDGLEHFDDARAASGSQEERALLLPLVDGEISTVDVFAVPFFSDGRRVGESFVATDDPALANVIVVDRAGLAASRTSHVLAHELGHVLLRSGDHPDEGSRDTPRLLMDSDASDASRFGPRLLTTDECARARKQGSSPPMGVLQPVARPAAVP